MHPFPHPRPDLIATVPPAVDNWSLIWLPQTPFRLESFEVIGGTGVGWEVAGLYSGRVSLLASLEPTELQLLTGERIAAAAVEPGVSITMTVTRTRAPKDEPLRVMLVGYYIG